VTGTVLDTLANVDGALFVFGSIEEVFKRRLAKGNINFFMVE
jgi:hypothetical protein